MKISLLVFSYNQEKFIAECIDSILAQELMPDEIIINDDFSSDATWKIINEKLSILNSDKINIILNRSECNIGVVKSVTEIMSKATGDIFVFCAGDDVCLPNRIRLIMQNFEKNKKIKGVFTNSIIINEKSEIKHHQFLKKPRYAKNLIDILINKPIWSIGASLAIKREIYDNYKEIPFEHISNDGIMAFRAILEGGFGYLHTPTILYRHHSNNLSQNLCFEQKLDYFNKKPLYFKELIKNANHRKLKSISIQLYIRYIVSKTMVYLLKLKILKSLARKIK